MTILRKDQHQSTDILLSIVSLRELEARAARVTEMERQNDILERKVSALSIELIALKEFFLDHGLTYADKY